MKKTVLTAIALIFTMLSDAGLASEITDASLNRLMTLSGTAKQVAQLPAEVQTGLDQASQQNSADNQFPMSAAEYEALSKLIADSFQPAMLMQALEQETRNAVSEEDAQAMFTWYTSEEGKRITVAEESVQDAAFFQEMASSAETLLADKARVQFVRDMDEQLQMTDMMINLQESMAVAMYMALVGNAGGEVDTAEFRKNVAAGLQDARPEIEKSMTLNYVYLYRGVDAPTMQKYLSFLKTPGAKRFSKSVEKGLSMGVKQATSTMATSLAQLARKKAGQQHATSGQKRPPNMPAAPFRE